MKIKTLVFFLILMAITSIALVYREKWKRVRGELLLANSSEQWLAFETTRVARGMMLDRQFVKSFHGFDLDPKVECLGTDMKIQNLEEIVSQKPLSVVLTFDQSCCFPCVEDEMVALLKLSDSLPGLNPVIIGKFENPRNLLEIDAIKECLIPAFSILNPGQALPSEFCARPTYLLLNQDCKVLDVLVIDKEFEDLDRILLRKVIEDFCLLP